MHRKLIAAMVLSGGLVILPLAAQEAAESDSGMLPRWEVVEMAGELEAHSATVQEILAKIDPQQWVADGAPQAYVNQHENLQRDAEYLQSSAQGLGRTPEKLTVVIDTYLWLDRMHAMLSSLEGGVRKYQSAPVADLLVSVAGKNAGAIEELKGYMRQLAATAESEMAIAHEEAQRCRSELMNRPAQ